MLPDVTGQRSDINVLSNSTGHSNLLTDSPEEKAPRFMMPVGALYSQVDKEWGAEVAEKQLSETAEESRVQVPCAVNGAVKCLIDLRIAWMNLG